MFMYGGVGFAAAIEALERTTRTAGRLGDGPHLSSRPPSVLDLDVRVFTRPPHDAGAHLGPCPGSRDHHRFRRAGRAAGGAARINGPTCRTSRVPEDCERVQIWPTMATISTGAWNCGMPKGRCAATERRRRTDPWRSGRALVEEYEITPSMLAIFADYVPSAIGPALGQDNSSSSSLDNTLRIRQVVPTRWVFCDITVTGLHAGFAHGDMRLFAETGELMATASQSMVVRRQDWRSLRRDGALSMQTPGLRSFHGRSASNCAASRNKVASSPELAREHHAERQASLVPGERDRHGGLAGHVEHGGAKACRRRARRARSSDRPSCRLCRA